MAYRFVVRARAEHDIQRVFDWYESERPGLGDEFLDLLSERFKEIRERLESFPIIYRDVRRAVVPRFPYLIFYVVNAQLISVLAVLHDSRNPSRWPRR